LAIRKLSRGLMGSQAGRQVKVRLLAMRNLAVSYAEVVSKSRQNAALERPRGED
jgi:hypothetical protein